MSEKYAQTQVEDYLQLFYTGNGPLYPIRDGLAVALRLG